MSTIETKTVITASELDASVRRRIAVLSDLEVSDDEAWHDFAESLADDYLAGLPARWAIFNFLSAVPDWVANVFLERAKFFESAACRDLDWFLHTLIKKAGDGGEDEKRRAQAWVMRAQRMEALREGVARAYLPLVSDKVTEYLLKEVIGTAYLPASSMEVSTRKVATTEQAVERRRQREANLAKRAQENRARAARAGSGTGKKSK